MHAFKKIKFSSNKNNVTMIAMMTLYKVALDILYIFVVSPNYLYHGFTYIGISVSFFISWIIYFFLLFILPKTKDDIKTIFLNLQHIIIITPMLTVYGLSDQSFTYIMMVLATVLIEIYLLKKYDNKTPGIQISINKKKTLLFLSFFIIAVYFSVLFYCGFYGFKAFDFNFLYIIRANRNMPIILSYLVNWTTNAIIPFLILYFLEKKKYFYVLCLCITMVLLYMSLGNKSIYLSSLVLIVAYILTKFKMLLKGIYLGMTIIFLVLSIASNLILPPNINALVNLSNGIVGERFLMGPALNKNYYFQCFSEYPKVVFSDGLIGKSLGLFYPYKGSMGQTIFAYQYKGQLFKSNSSTGYLGDSFGQFGFIGMLFTGVLLSCFIKLISIISDSFSNSLIYPLLTLLVVLLNDSAFISIFISSGWLILLLLLIIFSKPGDDIYERKNL